MDFALPGLAVPNGAAFRLGQTWGGPSLVASSGTTLGIDESTSTAAVTALLFFVIASVGSLVSYMTGVLFHAMIYRYINFRSGVAVLMAPVSALVHLVLVCVLLDEDIHREGVAGHYDSLQTLFLGNLAFHGGILVVLWLVTSVRDMYCLFMEYKALGRPLEHARIPRKDARGAEEVQEV